MTGVTALLDRNQSFAEQFDAGDLAIRPRMSTIILTCLDAPNAEKRWLEYHDRPFRLRYDVVDGLTLPGAP